MLCVVMVPRVVFGEQQQQYKLSEVIVLKPASVGHW